MHLKHAKSGYTVLIGLAAVCCLALLIFYFRAALLHGGEQLWALVTDREKTTRFVAAFGEGAPVVFMLFQILQVIFAPIPGEATGFIGGYLFGAVSGFIYSSIALTIGSWINFSIGRFFGKRFIRKMIPARHLARFDSLVSQKGAILIFIFFIFPGFPKDYLCLFLGLSAMPLKVFVLMAAVGRMPGTFILSLQGAMLFEENYILLVFVLLISVLAAWAGYRYRDPLSRWLEKQNQQSGQA
ncbi:MAG: TVP38/TMEM64 family protein, partial [Deltaproteobacteria bacterium]|nr:TVP38/TMEM64 family protein [Deltaproteobacteria bacterium]